ncbi:hypothetical protein A3B02_01990 [Candidatus Roizmanbacteria bacterium RIFCSPLOWO2_01_FULL_42_14]|uniref:Glycosyltransferase RgtA/B/C/D-like domain-containing protein n=1 Tax=Candidatus Roizmanbacteria bacterium RIFCSPLOWO2_01_FULL_42_14 TaxID=1802068 RepID=A0A1F7JA48_9BACT|nr:MAG: hypothetical protein A3B02_01990 [Candidatus Roizmanbacteria bacterium RIFCSPLOWO2_01_FULL_42_14]
MPLIQVIRKHPYAAMLVGLTCIGLFLRLYKLDAFAQFLGDQGRDAIVLKRIVTLEHFPAVGAPSSIGQVYLGPFYYYLIAPWLLLGNFNPIGPAIGVAVFSTLFIPIMYFGLSQLFNKETGLVAAVFVTFSSTLVSLSRFSWNPNLLPLFGFLAIFSLLKALDTHKKVYWALAGVFFSCAMQLHYIVLAAGPGVVFLLGHYLYQQKKKLHRAIWNVNSMVVAFILTSLPLIVFDLRHDLLNISNFLRIFEQSQAASTSGGIWEIVKTFAVLSNFAFNISIQTALAILLLIFLMLMPLSKPAKNNRFFPRIVLMFFLTLIITSYFTLNKYPHYFGFLYPLFLSIFAYILATTLFYKSRSLLFLILGMFITFQISGYDFLWQKGTYQIKRAQSIAESIYPRIQTKKYQITSLPDHYGDSTQRYYLELWEKRPLDKDSRELADELFVMCEQPCKPIGDPQWDIAYFRPRRITDTWDVEGVTIYKLVR